MMTALEGYDIPCIGEHSEIHMPYGRLNGTEGLESF